MFYLSVLLLSAAVATASECDDAHLSNNNVNKRGMIQCVMRGVPAAVSHPVSNPNDKPAVTHDKPAVTHDTAGVTHDTAGVTHDTAHVTNVAQVPESHVSAPAQANDASKHQVEIGLGVALAMCLLL